MNIVVYFAGLCPSATVPDTLSSQLFVPTVFLSLLVLFGYLIHKGNHGHRILKAIGILGTLLSLFGFAGVIAVAKLLPAC